MIHFCYFWIYVCLMLAIGGTPQVLKAIIHKDQHLSYWHGLVWSIACSSLVSILWVHL